MEYKSVEKFLNKNGNNKKTRRKHNFLYSFMTKIFICIILFLFVLIYIKQDYEGSSKIRKYLYENNINMATINKWYQKHFGDITPFENIIKDKTKLVFNNEFEYQNIEKYKDGAKLKIPKEYLIPVLESGIVVFIGEKDDYGKTVIIEQTNGVDCWYGNVTNINLELYDYVSKGEILGEASDTLYLVFQKGGKFVNYEDYIK